MHLCHVQAQDAVKSKTATVLAIEAARSRHPSMTYCDQNIVLQTPEEDRCPPIPGENPLIDLLHRSFSAMSLLDIFC
jgi:hypothetical protein